MSEVNNLQIFNNYYIVHYEDGVTACEKESYRMAPCSCREWRHLGRCFHTLALHLIYSKYSLDSRTIPTDNRIQQMARTDKVSEDSAASCLSLQQNVAKERDMALEFGLSGSYKFRCLRLKASQTAALLCPQWVLGVGKTE